MSVFKTMAIKSQDTLNSKIEFYEQQIKNLNLQLKTKDDELNLAVQDKNNIQIMNDKLVLENEKLTGENKSLQNKIQEQDKDINDLKIKNAELLNHISQIGKYEKENKKLENKLEKLSKEQSVLIDSVENVKKEHELNAKMQILDMQNKYNELQIDYLKIKEELNKIKESKKGSIILK
jgi:chromosome segregation ATPase